MTDLFNRIVIHEDFYPTIELLKKHKIELPYEGSKSEFDFELSKEGNLEVFGDFVPKELDPVNGMNLVQNNLPIFAYDESFQSYKTLEGTGYLTSHVITFLGEKDYIPSSYISFHFLTRSNQLVDAEKRIKLTDNQEILFKRLYTKERKFLFDNIIQGHSLVLIDGPLLGGQISKYTVELDKSIVKKESFPIHIVKNSSSSLIIDNFSNLKGKFNSDFHWAHTFLKPGERTPFFRYEDKYNSNFSKIFCYLRHNNESPQRIEFLSILKDRTKEIKNFFDVIYYLFLCNGNSKNCQIRPIVVSEKYARTILSIFNLKELVKNLHLIPTMNEKRFG